MAIFHTVIHAIFDRTTTEEFYRKDAYPSDMSYEVRDEHIQATVRNTVGRHGAAIGAQDAHYEYRSTEADSDAAALDIWLSGLE